MKLIKRNIWTYNKSTSTYRNKKRRLDKFHRISADIEYASDSRILEEFEFADKILRKIGCRTIDVTQRAIEDTALIIMEKLGVK